MANNGTWFDTKSGKVVTSEPEEGIQLVAPGMEPTDAERQRVDAYKGDTSNADATVTTSSAKK